MTQNERTAQIHRQFDISFGEFDGYIRGEQAVIAGQRGGRGGGMSGRDGMGDAAGAGGGQEGGDGAGGAEGSGGDRTGAGQSGSGGGQGQGQGQGQQGQQGQGQSGGGGVGGGAAGGGGPNTIPADIPDGSDDDVIARQLREAAINESDPELREKLWQEYRNYKKSGG